MRPQKIIIYRFYFPHLFSVSSSQHDACWECCKNRTPGLMQTTRSHHSNSCDSSWWGHSHCAQSVVVHSFSDCVFCGQCTVTQANLQCPCWWLYSMMKLYREGCWLSREWGSVQYTGSLRHVRIHARSLDSKLWPTHSLRAGSGQPHYGSGIKWFFIMRHFSVGYEFMHIFGYI